MLLLVSMFILGVTASIHTTRIRQAELTNIGADQRLHDGIGELYQPLLTINHLDGVI